MGRSSLFLFSSACVFSGTVLLLARAQGREELPVVPEFDLARYAGQWFEIARLPNRFQRQCARDVTATYTLQPGGKVKVLNRCVEADGRASTIQGSARPAEAGGSPARLKVTFFWPFAGDYQIIALDKDYRWAMVGTPNRKYLWILSRTQELPAATYDGLLARAKALSFDIAQVQRTEQAD